MTKLILKEEVFAVMGAALEVHKELGPGFLEAVYQEALEIELNKRGISFKSQKPMIITYKGMPLKKEYIADFVSHNEILIEIKAIESLGKREEAQLLHYLKATGLKVGLLINFNSYGRLEWKRFVR
ncbi:MAG: GxxExxY protein [Deltaproteobacteria bacterium]|nr:GxxExxY protein [Deltaproteobacteria bacterium]